MNLSGELKSESGFEAQVLEYGPGFFVPYFKKDKSEDVENILSEFRALLESLNFKGKVVLEMGRFLAAACGYYVTSIVDMKVNKRAAICDHGRWDQSPELLWSGNGYEAAILYTA